MPDSNSDVHGSGAGPLKGDSSSSIWLEPPRRPGMDDIHESASSMNRGPSASPPSASALFAQAQKAAEQSEGEQVTAPEGIVSESGSKGGTGGSGIGRGLWNGPGAVESEAAVAAEPSTPEPRSPASGFLLTFLFTWASVATLTAMWLWWRWPEERSPLEVLPDDGIMDQKIVSPLERLSRRNILHLGESKRIGDLVIQPTSITQQSVNILPEGQLTEPVMVLRIRIENRSATTTFCPIDPVFLYYPDPRKKLENLPQFDMTGYTYTFIHPANNIEQVVLPFDLVYSQGYHVDGQEFPMLRPGESKEVVVISDEGAREQLERTMIWRVKLRVGFNARGDGVASVIGVAFDLNDVVDEPS